MATAGSLHHHTPTLAVIDPRGLPSRTVRYCRTPSVRDAGVRVERVVFNAAGRGVAQWDARLWSRHEAGEAVAPNQVTTFSLSGQALATASVDAGWRVALPGQAGQVREAWDGRGSHTRCVFDGLLRPVAAYEQVAGEAERCVERLVYGDSAKAASNRCGRLLRHDDPAGTRRWTSFGLRGQALDESRAFLQTLEAPDWPEDEVERDALLEPEVFTTTWSHDALGAVLIQVDARGHEQRQAYTVAGQLRESVLTLSGGPELRLVDELAYNAFGQVESQVAGNDVRSTAIYDPAAGRLLHLAASRPGGAVLQALSYFHDPMDNVLRIEDGTAAVTYFANRESDGINTYVYDSLYQLIEATGRETPGGVSPGLPGTIPLPGPGDPSILTPYSERYVYDTGGNLTSLTHQGLQNWGRRVAVSPASNRSLPWAQGAPEPDVEGGFDANGNLKCLEGQPLEWGVRNQLQQASQLPREDGAADRERYIYDSNQQRVRKVTLRQARTTTHAAEVRYLPGLELRTDTATGEVLDVVTVSTGLTRVRALRWHAGRPPGIPNDQLRYLINDHLGSAVLEVDDQGRLMSQEGYYPYGGTAWRAARNAIEVKYKVTRYSGLERDQTGLLYYGLRYYIPWLQKWLNPDPAGAVDGLNLFRMVKGNPIGLVDKQGLGALPVVGEAPDDYRYFPIGLTSINEMKDIRPAGNAIPINDDALVYSIEPPKDFSLDGASRDSFNEAAEGTAFTGVAHIHTGVIYLAPLRASGRSMPHTNRTWDNATVTNINGKRVRVSPITHNSPGPSHSQLASKIEIDQKDLVGFSVIRGVNGGIYSMAYTSRSSQNAPLIKRAGIVATQKDFHKFKFVKSDNGRKYTHFVEKLPEKWANPIRNSLVQAFGASDENPNPFAQAGSTPIQPVISLPPPPPARPVLRAIRRTHI